MKNESGQSTAVLVLAHLMGSNGELGEETQKRVEAAVSLFRDGDASHIITTGWDYRKDSDLKIAEVIRHYLIDICHLDPDCVLSDINSRDTVGDAYFVKRNIVGKMAFGRLTVVTSGYHVKRTREIFERFFLPNVAIEVFGVDVPSNYDCDILAHERSSLQAFRKTFAGVDFTSDEDVFAALSSKHPFYNGEVHPGIL
ncbi:YdcF family protein [Thalassospira sp. HF15]|uniref:YdcF family protein n=1 Tax=Thalassospira sp. HF15 TaxID=2722755 RepID=UPI0014301ACD|nr:YdcF family protein [Thalassospira sp. HF15]NIY76219.1 YdcF family protein [Thalassospira sp. HF15]